ncbi:DNA recombination protein RmuC, partial [Gammaproteobacteria bacterium]|nr:DNA recombination protein RmuC [Gammaproteobacteria bacterium]
FKTQLSDFRQKVDQVYTTDAKDRASLLTEVRNLQRASEKVNEEAENLTRALKGDKRLQGNWGELVLERVLEESGLRKDHEYVLQRSLRNADGDIKRPDVIIHLPEDKDVVVDAKVSLVAYETAVSSDDDAAREVAIKRHVQSVRAHVRKLSEQSYDQLPGVRSLDFVLLFVPVESAFTLAMEKDPSLFTEAFDKRLVIVSPTTLMMTLRIIDNVWRYEKQNKNAQEIARRAGALYDKLRVVLEDMDQLGRNLDQASRSYDSAYARLAKGRGNLVRQVEQFRELGATVKRSIPQEIVDDADE